jgi:endonuclease G, mitochondrial
VDNRTQAKVKSKDYTNTGFDRGHMAPNHGIATRYGKDAQLETFLMTNVCPQKPNMNRKVWRKLEAIVADDYSNRLEEVWVITGPVFAEKPERFPSGISVPTAFYKIIVDELNGTPRMLAFIVSQGVKGNEATRTFLVNVDTIEQQAGLDLFSDLEDGLEEKLESETAKEMW